MGRRNCAIWAFHGDCGVTIAELLFFYTNNEDNGCCAALRVGKGVFEVNVAYVGVKWRGESEGRKQKLS